MRFADERIKLVGEILAGMKVLKMQAWETRFAEIATAVRRKELAVMFKLLLFKIWTVGAVFTSPLVVSLLTLLTYSLTGGRQSGISTQCVCMPSCDVPEM